MAATSVLDGQRVRALLVKLTRDERRRALEGMELLAWTSRQLASEVKTKNKPIKERSFSC
jgi:hypothetical protein